MMDYEDAKQEFRLADDGDTYARVMMWLFAVSDTLHFDRDDDTPMVEFDYQPSPIQSEPEYSPEYEIVREMPDTELIHFGRVLNRYVDMLKAQGKV